jgi:hypothetical protein
VLANTNAFTRPGIAFRQMNGVTDQLPDADLLIAKDVLQHWSNADVSNFLPKLKSFRMALITNGFDPSRMNLVNHDIESGGWRPVDLSKAPFNLDGSYVYWFNGDEIKYVFLWINPRAA